jgi:TATA-box binding protein (TBP) (component of TFIID and TFIIIB)
MGQDMHTGLSFLLFNKQLAPRDRELKSHLIQCMVGGQSIVTQDLYKSGKNVMTGARDENAALLGAHKARLKLAKKTQQWPDFRDFTKQNVVAFFGLGFPLDTKKLFDAYKSCLQPPEAVRNFKPVAEKRRELYRKPVAPGNQRKKANHGTVTAMSNEEKFKGIQIYWNHPLVQVCFRAGTGVITGTDDEDDILAVLKCVEDWEEFRLQRPSSSILLRNNDNATRQDVQVVFFEELARIRREATSSSGNKKQLLRVENGGPQAIIKKYSQQFGGVTQVIRNPQLGVYRKTKMKTKMIETLLTKKTK